jgi:hypothetical protein
MRKDCIDVVMGHVVEVCGFTVAGGGDAGRDGNVPPGNKELTRRVRSSTSDMDNSEAFLLSNERETKTDYSQVLRYNIII